MNTEYPKLQRWNLFALIPICAGLFWLTQAPTAWLFWGLIPGGLLLASGVALLLWPADARIIQYLAVGGLLGTVLWIPALFAGGFMHGLVAGILSLASFLTAGRQSLVEAAVVEGALPAQRTLSTYAKAAVDEALMVYLAAGVAIPGEDAAEQACMAAARIERELKEGGVLAEPLSLHPQPPVPHEFTLTPGKAGKTQFENLSFASGYMPTPELPEGDRWSARVANRQCHAIVLRHEGRARPWLIGIHGYRMGNPRMTLRMFQPEWLHQRLDLNLVLPTLPLHGPRSIGGRSGDRFLDGDPLDVLHALSQSLWDLRRTVAWIRLQEPEARIGVFGCSLGGYCTALLSSYEAGLDFVIAGVPVIDLAPVLWRNFLHRNRGYYESRGFTMERYRGLLQIVSPIARPPLVTQSRRAIFAGTADRVVQQQHPMLLSEHWDVPVAWYQGGHVTFHGEPSVRQTIMGMMTSAGWIEPGMG